MSFCQSLKPTAVHASFYFLACVFVSLLWLSGWVSDVSSQVILACGACIAVLGVPHGGLDHWLGRKLLGREFGKMWALVFFPAYLLVAAMVAWLWINFSVPTILLFFLLSAWHFGREEKSERSLLATVAVGGLIIWLAAFLRPQEMAELLVILMPTDVASGLSVADASRIDEAKLIVQCTQGLALFLIPVGLSSGLYTAAKNRRASEWMNILAVRLGTFLAVLMAPILVSFTAYFCFWHSLLGLRRLQVEEGLSIARFTVAAMPLSLMAVLLILMITHLTGQLTLQSVGQHAGLQMIFIGLSAIAVPHVLLHESQAWLEHRLPHSNLQTLEAN